MATSSGRCMIPSQTRPATRSVGPGRGPFVSRKTSSGIKARTVRKSVEGPRFDICTVSLAGGGGPSFARIFCNKKALSDQGSNFHSKVLNFAPMGKAASDPLRKFEGYGRTALNLSGTSNTDHLFLLDQSPDNPGVLALLRRVNAGSRT